MENNWSSSDEPKRDGVCTPSPRFAIRYRYYQRVGHQKCCGRDEYPRPAYKERYPNDLFVRHIDLLRTVVRKVRERRPSPIDAWVILP